MNREGFIICVRAISSLILADAIVTTEEKDFLTRVMDDLSFTEEERVAGRIPLLEAGELEGLKELTEPLRKSLIKLLVKAAKADGFVDQREVAFVDRCAQLMGVAPADLEELWARPGGPPTLSPSLSRRLSELEAAS